ncbi:uncharacterized protein LOC142152001 [Mixophyes fleayi]|uniref:uncharacterized protein LOC142152001 n=1 Tax=Mixophyes fleayi TaxID=3061075 RepID=UPI003F4DEE00
MWHFFNRSAKQKDGRWLEFSGGSCISWSSAAIRYLRWQHLFLLFICFSDLSVWAQEQAMPASSLLQKLHAGQSPHTLLKRLPLADEQNSVTQMPFWKPKVLKSLPKALTDNSGYNSHIFSLNFNKQYKQSRLKRELETISKNNSVRTSKWSSAISKIFRQIFGENLLSVWSGKEDHKSVAGDNIRILSPNLQVEPLRNTNLLSKDEILDHVVEIKPNISIPAQEMQALSTLKYSRTSKLEDMSSVHSLNEPETTKSESAFSSEWTATTLPFLRTQNVQSNDGLHAEKSINYTDWRGVHFSVMDVTEIPTTNGTRQMVNLTSPLLPNLSNDYTNTVPHESSNSFTKIMSTMEQRSDIVKATNENLDLTLGMSIYPPLQTSTLNTVRAPSFEFTTASLQFDTSVSVKYQTSSSLVKPTVTVFANVHTSDKKSSLTTPLIDSSSILTTPHIDSSSIFTSLYLQKQDNWELTPFISETFSISDLPSTRETLEITSSNTDHNTPNVYQIIRTEGIMERRSSVMDSQPVSTLFTSYKVKPTTPVTNLHTSDIAPISEHALNFGEQTDTAVPWAISTLSASKIFSSSEESHVSTDLVHLLTDYSKPSNITEQPYMAKDDGTSVLQAPHATITQTPFKLSETPSFPIMESTTYESDKPGLSASKNVTLDNETMSDGNVFTTAMYSDVYSTESEFPSTMNLSSFDHDFFHDWVDENGKLNQSTFNWTSTQTSSISPALVSKSTVSASHKQEPSPWSFNTTIVPQHFNVTKDHTTPFFHPGSVNVSLSARTGQESLKSTPVPTLTHRTPFTMAAVEASSPIKHSSYHPSMTTHQVSTTVFSTEKQKMPQHTATSQSHKSLKSSAITASSSYLTPKTQAGTTTKSVFNLLVSTIRTSSQPSVSIPLQSRNRTMAPTSSILKPAITYSTPAPKLWIPQSTAIPPKSTISVKSINYSLTHEVSATPSLRPTSPLVIKVPMNFQLTDVLYSKQLGNRTTDEYKRLEREIKLVMNKIFSTKYGQKYVQTEVLEFLNGSVIVRSKVVFDSNLPKPSGSDIVRTVLSDIYGTKNYYFGWNINGSTVESEGYTQKNLELETLPISLLVLRVGFIAVVQSDQEKLSFLENLQKQVFQAVNLSFPITKVSFSQIRDVYGDLEVRGNLYLNSPVYTNVQSLLSTLLPLVNRSVDFSSITVDGVHSELQIHTIQFHVINEQFMLNLLDKSSSEFQKLSKDLSTVVQAVLHDSNPLQVIIREFKSGSLVCIGNLLYKIPAPGSGEILRLLLNTLGSDGRLGSSPYKVDSKSITIGDSSPGPYDDYVGFPGFGVAIIVMCGLTILIFPTLIYMCYKTRMLGHRNKATIPQQPDQQSHHFEMDNRAFRASIEQP